MFIERNVSLQPLNSFGIAARAARMVRVRGEDDVRAVLSSRRVRFGNLRRESLSLEDAFIGLTGKY